MFVHSGCSLIVLFVFLFKQKTAYEMLRSLVGSEMCIRDRFDGVIQPELPESAKPATPLILGVLLIVLMRVAPMGIAGSAKMLMYRRRVIKGVGDSSVEPVTS